MRNNPFSFQIERIKDELRAGYPIKAYESILELEKHIDDAIDLADALKKKGKKNK